MNMPSRRAFLATAGAGAAAAALAACSSAPNVAPGSSNANTSKENTGAMSNFGVGTQFKATKPLSLSIAILSNPNYPYKANWLFFTHLKALTNVDLTANANVIPYADYTTKVSTLIDRKSTRLNSSHSDSSRMPSSA